MRQSTVLKSERPALDDDPVGHRATMSEEQLHATGHWSSILRAYALTIRLTLKGFRLTEQQYATLLEIHSSDPARPLTVGTLAARLGIRHNSAVAAINRLCERGFVSRVRSKKDRRMVCLQLTGDGRAVLTKLMLADSRHVSNIELELAQLARAKPTRGRPETA